MAICNYCGKEMLVHTSCLPYIVDHGMKTPRIRYGKEKIYGKHNRPAGICKDCGCKLGEFHHFHCDVEESPFTGRQLLMEITESMTVSK